MEAINIIAYPSGDEQTNAIKAFLKALKIKFTTEKPHNKEFVNKIIESKKQFEKGQYISVKKDKIRDLLKL